MDTLVRNQAPTPIMVTEVGTEVSELQNQIRELEATASILFTRLEGVTAKRGGDTSNKTEPPKPVLCEHAETLLQLRQRITTVTDNLRKQIDLLQI